MTNLSNDSAVPLVPRKLAGFGALIAYAAVLALLYGAMDLDLARFHSFWSPDCGVRFWMIRNWHEHGSLTRLLYSDAETDPGWRLHPLSLGYPGYLALLKRGTATIYPPLFPFVSGISYRLLGFAGLTLIPTLAGLTTAWLISLTAQRIRLRSWSFLPVIVGLATPVALYSVVFWDHVVQILLCAAAAFFLWEALGEGSRRYAFAAGITLGLGVWFHEFFFALFLSFLLGGWSFRKSAPQRPLLPLFSLGFTLPVTAWLLFNWCVFGTPLGPHALGNNNLAQPALVHRMFNVSWIVTQSLWQLAGKGPWAEFACYLLMFFAILSWADVAPTKFAALFYLIVAGGAWFLLRSAHWTGGLLEATPLFLPAVAGRWYARFGGGQDDASVRRDYLIWMSRTALFFALAVLVAPLGGGVINWGNRCLLTELPLLVLVGAAVVERQFQETEGGGRRFLTIGLAALIAVSGYSQLLGYRAIRQQMAENQVKAAEVNALAADVVATDDWTLWPFLAASPLPARCFIVRNREADRKLFSSILAANHVTRFAYRASEGAVENLAQGLQDQHPRWSHYYDSANHAGIFRVERALPAPSTSNFGPPL